MRFGSPMTIHRARAGGERKSDRGGVPGPSMQAQDPPQKVRWGDRAIRALVGASPIVRRSLPDQAFIVSKTAHASPERAMLPLPDSSVPLEEQTFRNGRSPNGNTIPVYLYATPMTNRARFCFR
jgi:hypothetical protein